jgi:hypothetical protein
MHNKKRRAFLSGRRAPRKQEFLMNLSVEAGSLVSSRNLFRLLVRVDKQID